MAQTPKKSAKKSFYEVKAPLTSTKIQLYSDSLESLNGKTIKLDLTKSLRGKSLELKLRIKSDGQELEGIPERVELANSFIRRVVRKGTDYCEDSFETETKDAIVRIKPFLIARRRVSRTVLNALRQGAKKHLENYLKTRSSQEIFSEIISNKLQKQLALQLKKIYPLALCEIRVFELIKPLEKKKVAKEEIDAEKKDK